MKVDITPLFNPGKVKADSRKARAAIEAATISSLNKLATQGMNQGRRAMTDTYNIKASDIRPALKVIKAKRSEPVASIRVRESVALPVFKFGGRPKAVPSQAGIKAPYKRRTKASAKILKRGQRVKYQHAFVAQMPSGHTGIFERVPGKKMIGKNKQAIRELTALGIPAMFESTAIKAVDELVMKKGQDIFQHELDYRLKKAGIK